MKRNISLNQIEERIRNSPKITIFLTSDFTDLASSDAANKALLRLEEAGLIRRILFGVYEYPDYNEFLNEYVEPSPDKVAHALARKFGWTIVPCGDTALNMLGLSTQVPSICFTSATERTRNTPMETRLSNSSARRIRKFQRFLIRPRLSFRR